MKIIQYFIEYGALRVVEGIIRALPERACRTLARVVANTTLAIAPIRWDVVTGNLSAAFPDKSSLEIERLARAVYQQFAMTAVEMLKFRTYTPAQIIRMVDITGIELFDRARAGGKGAIIVGAHYGNWELMGAAVAQLVPLRYVIGKQQNPFVDGLLNDLREIRGIGLIPLEGALRGVLRTLRHNEFVGILADQDAHAAGAFVQFFGRPASTPRGPAAFALRAGSPLILGTMVRQADGRFAARFEEITSDRSGSDDDVIFRLTEAFTARLEARTREHPDHWFWFHKRWKTSPPSA